MCHQSSLLEFVFYAELYAKFVVAKSWSSPAGMNLKSGTAWNRHTIVKTLVHRVHFYKTLRQIAQPLPHVMHCWTSGNSLTWILLQISDVVYIMVVYRGQLFRLCRPEITCRVSFKVTAATDVPFSSVAKTISKSLVLKNLISSMCGLSTRTILAPTLSVEDGRQLLQNSRLANKFCCERMLCWLCILHEGTLGGFSWNPTPILFSAESWARHAFHFLT